MAYSEPPSVKAEVKRAGRAISENRETHADLQLVNQWRASHGYVINTFKVWIKRHLDRGGFQAEFAQRLKRQNTVVDKLKRQNSDGTYLISDVTQMHDLAGCRLIFESLEELLKFRDYFRSADVQRNVLHRFRHVEQKFDYISQPKPTGYRGIHEVIRHFPRGSERKDNAKKPWDGLLGEIQLRTRHQHAWATAVEISDLVDRQRIKFTQNNSPRHQFFALTSEIIARQHEDVANAFCDLSLEELQDRAEMLEEQLGVLARLRLLRAFDIQRRFKTHNVLNIVDLDGDLNLQIETFNSPTAAIARATELESDPHSLNAVYVRADNPAQLRSAYRNYFNDPVAFVELLDF